MDKSDIYFIIRFLTMFAVGWIVGFKEPEKLLGVVACILAWQYSFIREAREERETALQKQRAELVRDTYGSKV